MRMSSPRMTPDVTPSPVVAYGPTQRADSSRPRHPRRLETIDRLRFRPMPFRCACASIAYGIGWPEGYEFPTTLTM